MIFIHTFEVIWTIDLAVFAQKYDVFSILLVWRQRVRIGYLNYIQTNKYPILNTLKCV